MQDWSAFRVVVAILCCDSLVKLVGCSSMDKHQWTMQLVLITVWPLAFHCFHLHLYMFVAGILSTHHGLNTKMLCTSYVQVMYTLWNEYVHCVLWCRNNLTISTWSWFFCCIQSYDLYELYGLYLHVLIAFWCSTARKEALWVRGDLLMCYLLQRINHRWCTIYSLPVLYHVVYIL